VPVLCLVCLWAAVQRVKATSSGVEVRNFVASRSISWREIERFTVGPFQLLPAVCIILLRDGSSYRAGAIQAPNLTRGRTVNGATRLVDALNQRLGEARGD
jgi:hypothetical protein